MPSSFPDWADYLRWMIITSIVVIFTAGMVNIVIDPLGVFASPRVSSLNAKKPYLDHHRELSRYQRARRLCSDTGIFGNSRAEIGFDPENKVLSAHGLSAFNHAIPGSGADTSLRQIIWLQAANCLPKTVFLGIEFFDFLGGDRPRPLPTLETAPAPERDLRFFAEAVFSITGLRDSLATILLQRSRYSAISTERGFNPLLNYIPEVEQNGHHALFRQRAEENARNWMRKPLNLRPQGGGVSNDEVTLDAILSRLTRAGSTTYLIIYPYHAQIRLMIERLGMGDLFADWKRLVVATAEYHAKDGSQIEVWDFSGLSPETLEPIPEKGDNKTRLANFWEAGHFKKELGEYMTARVLGEQSGFGIKLDSSNIEVSLIEDRLRVQTLLATPSPMVREVNELLTSRRGR